MFDAENPYGNRVQGETVYVALYWEDMDREELSEDFQ